MQDTSSYAHAAAYAQDYFAPTHPDQYVESRPSEGVVGHDTSRPKASLKRSRNYSLKPDLVTAATGDNDECSGDSEPDRKRNKLAYQRSTIACVHCRRRKIRCVMPKEDEPKTGKCAHCTRMKKSCSFVPVDQSITKSKKRQETLGTAVREPQLSPKAPKQLTAFDHERLFNYGATDLSYAGLMLPRHGNQSIRQRSATCSDAPTCYPMPDTFEPFLGALDKPRSASIHGPEIPLVFHENLPVQHTSHSTSASVWARSPSPFPQVRKDSSSFEMSAPNPFASSLSRLADNYSNNVSEQGHSAQSLSADAVVADSGSYDASSDHIGYRDNVSSTMPMPQLTFESSYINPQELSSSVLPGNTFHTDSFNTLPYENTPQNHPTATSYPDLPTPSLYLSPTPTRTTTTSNNSIKSSISPMPASEAYLSPPTSEPTSFTKSTTHPDFTPSLLPSSLLTPPDMAENLSEFYTHQDQHFKSQSQPRHLTSSRINSISMPPPLKYETDFPFESAYEKQNQNHNNGTDNSQSQQQLLNMIYTTTSPFETQGYTATSGPDELGLFFPS